MSTYHEIAKKSLRVWGNVRNLKNSGQQIRGIRIEDPTYRKGWGYWRGNGGMHLYPRAKITVIFTMALAFEFLFYILAG